MLVISYSDFYDNPIKFKDVALRSGIKILPEKKQKFSRRIQKKIDALNSVAGLIPSNIDADKILDERRMSK